MVNSTTDEPLPFVTEEGGGDTSPGSSEMSLPRAKPRGRSAQLPPGAGVPSTLPLQLLQPTSGLIFPFIYFFLTFPFVS